MSIQFTPAAVLKICQNGQILRITVKSGGCSGMRYVFTFEAEPKPHDHIFAEADARVMVDPLSFNFLKDATLDYKDEMMASSFVIMNPQAKNSCGCGDSFSIF